MTETTWTTQYGDETVYVQAHVHATDPLAVRFIFFTGDAEALLFPDPVVRRELGEDVASVWQQKEPSAGNDPATLHGSYERLDDTADADDLVLAVVELANWLTPIDLLDICRELATEAVDAAIDALSKLVVEATNLEHRMADARTRLHCAGLTHRALSLDTVSARETAIAYLPTFVGSADDLTMLVHAVHAQQQKPGTVSTSDLGTDDPAHIGNRSHIADRLADI